MIKKIFITLLFLLTPQASNAYLEIYTQMGSGYFKMEEVNKDNIHHTHQSWFDFSYGFGARARFGILGVLYLGGMAEVAWNGHNVDRNWFDVSSSQNRGFTYRFEKTRYLAGPTLSIRIGDVFSIDGEYYSQHSMNITYSDDKRDNPFRKYERHAGRGWGAGFGLHFGFFNVNWLYRELTINSFNFSDSNDNIVGKTFDPLVQRESVITAGFEI